MKRLLIVVDYQNDFVKGALGFPEAEMLEQPIMDKIAAYRGRADKVAFTLDTHDSNYLATQEGQNLPVKHCLKGTAGHDLYGAVANTVRNSDEVFYKPAFGSGELFDWLATAQQAAEEVGEQPFESIELVGVVSNICVIANAILAKTACPEVPVIVDASCTAAGDVSLHEKALDVMEGLQIKVVNRR